MTLGRTSSGAIKIKTDGGTTRAVECACCAPPCQCPDGGTWVAPAEGVFKISSASWGAVTDATLSDECGNFSANAGGYFVNFIWACAGYWFASVYNGGTIGDGNPCNLLSVLIFSSSPAGTHNVIDDYSDGTSTICTQWTITISEV